MGRGDESIPSSERPEVGSVNIPLGEFPASSSNVAVDASKVASNIVARLNYAFSNKDYDAVAALFLEEKSYWRDHLALTWSLRTLKGREKIKHFLKSSNAGPPMIKIDNSSEFRAPRFGAIDGWGDVQGILFFITFETSLGRGQGLVRLAEDGSSWKLFTVYTVLIELKGHEEPINSRRTQGVQHGQNPLRKNWRERRDTEKEEPDPQVLIIGAGQGGLMIAARLKMLGMPSLIVDQVDRVGDNWRKRYKQLVLHDPVWYDHMPYLPFPPHWPIFTPKDKLAEWFEAYVNLLELNVWTSTRIISTFWSDDIRQWSVELERRTADGQSTTRTLRPKHIVQATGHSGKKNFPSIPGMSDFKGDRLCHSSEHLGANPASAGKQAIVVGCCNSAHDIAQDFFENGYRVTLVQRSSTCVVSSSSILNVSLKGLYDESSPPVDDADIYVWSTPSPLFKLVQQKITAAQAQLDKSLHDGLRKAGFNLDAGPMDSGLTVKYFQRGGGYYIDVGCSQLIMDGKIHVKQGHEIARIHPHAVEFADGTQLEADEVVFATGYGNMRTQCSDIFGAQVAERVKDVWGFNDEGEFRTMWQDSGHPGLWFMGGNLALCRFYSRLLALRIKAGEEGLVE